MILYIPGTPTPKQGMNTRAFHDKKTGAWRGMAIPKAKTVQNCHTMRSLMVQQLPHGFVPISQPVKIDYMFIYPPLKGFNKTQKKAIEEGCVIAKTTVPDCDNLEKAVNDAMNGVVLADDKLIWLHTAFKGFGKRPGIYLCIEKGSESLTMFVPQMLEGEEDVW